MKLLPMLSVGLPHMPVPALHAADTLAKPKVATPPEFVAITDDPKLPRVLMMGDSVSIACALEGRQLLAGVTWNDLWLLVKPHQAELRIPRNVHFQPKGSSVMAKQVAEMIRNALSARKIQP